MFPTTMALDQQHKQAKIYIEQMIEDLGLEDFIKFYRNVTLNYNRKEITDDEIKSMIENCPKYMCLAIETVRKEMERNE